MNSTPTKTTKPCWIICAFFSKGQWPERHFACTVLRDSAESTQDPINQVYQLGKFDLVRKLLDIEPSHCLEDNVRLREDPSTSAAILIQVNKDEKFQILGSTFRNDRIGSQSGRWIRVN